MYIKFRTKLEITYYLCNNNEEKSSLKSSYIYLPLLPYF